jgi:aryl-alcohol dehydrogenase-like predicted oxidoreductase
VGGWGGGGGGAAGPARPGYLNLGHAEDLGEDRSVAALRALTHELLDAAWEAGVRHFDAARSYGRAEEFLGEWLRSRRPEGAVVSSNLGYVYTAAWRVDADPPEVKHHDVETFRRQLAETREHLGDWLSLYAIHSATPESGVLADERVLDALEELRDDGMRIGVTVSGTSQPETIREALRLDLVEAVQATWNLHERSAEQALARAHEAGLRVYVKEALANGRLTERGGNAALATTARELGTTEIARALAAALARPWADVVLSGASTVAQLESNLKARTLRWDDELERRLADMAEDADAYWEARAQLAWN